MRRVIATKLELECCQLGYATESLVFLAKVHWFISNRDQLLPKSLVNHFAIVDTRLRAISAGAPSVRVQKCAERFLATSTRAMADLEVRWQSEERYSLLDSLEAMDEECIPKEWFKENSFLSQKCFALCVHCLLLLQ